MMKRKCLDSILILLCLIICAPVMIVVMCSTKTGLELSQMLNPVLNGTGEPMKLYLFSLYPTLRHYGKLLFYTPQFFTVFWNSVKIVGLILLGQLIVAVPAAWGFAKFNFKRKNIIFTLYIILMLMPFQVTMLPSYLVLNRINLMDTQYAVILPAIFSTFPVFIMHRSFTFIPKGLLEAAKVDGADDMGVFFHIGIPLGSTGILSALVLGFLEYWNMMEQPLAFIKTKSLWPLSLYLPEISFRQAGIALAASVITLLPAVFVFITGQEYLEQGIALSGIKE